MAGVTEIQERMATLNTQLRFGKVQQALIEGYKFRTFLMLSGVRSNEAKVALQRVERVIASLEGQRMTGIQKLVSSIVKTARASMNPTDEKSDTTSLLDRFEDKVEEEKDGEEDQDIDPDTGYARPKKVTEDKPLGDWSADDQPLGEF